MKIHVRSGDTLGYYSQLFSVPYNLIVDSNDLDSLSILHVGEEVHIPGFEPIPYRIQKGDTIWKIAEQQKIALDALMILNQQMSLKNLLPGSELLLPRRKTKTCIHSNKMCDYERFTLYVNQIKTIYPFLSVNTIGHSVLGKPIIEIRIGKGTKKVHMNGSFHANEWITTLVLMRLLDDYLLALTNGTSIRGCDPVNWYQDVTLSLVPMVNPDGVNLVLNGPPSNLYDKVLKINDGNPEFVHWKANIRGVDLNKQFPANWEIDKKRKAPQIPSPRDYPGTEPLTEPEAIAMVNLTLNSGFNTVLAFHTQGEELYWGYEGYEPPESEGMAKKFEINSGYKAIQYVDSHGGYKDWFLQEFRQPGFTIELGKGINPLPLSQINDILKKAAGIFFTALSG
jgi:g-D-glutamyl-meso-diaminopimelate peptidase